MILENFPVFPTLVFRSISRDGKYREIPPIIPHREIPGFLQSNPLLAYPEVKSYFDFVFSNRSLMDITKLNAMSVRILANFV